MNRRPTDMPNLLLLCEYASLNGGERSMLSTIDGVRAARFTPTVIGPPEGPLAETLRRREVELVPFAFGDASGKRFAQDRLRDQLAKVLRRCKPDLLHANSLAMGRLCGPVAAELGIPSLAHLRDIVKLSRQAVADLNCHTRLLAVSKATRQFHVAAGLSAEKTHVLHNGVDLEQFRPRQPSGYLHRELGLPDGAQLAATIGQIALRKGQDTLIEAAVIVAEKVPNLHYLIVGERFSQKDESRRFEATLRTTADASLAGRVHWLGRREDVDRLLGELTLLIHPARQEPLGRVLLEAAAAGVPIIATAVGGTPEIFPQESQAAQLVPPNNPTAMAREIERTVCDPTLQTRLATAARRRAEETFTIRQAAAGLIDHYRQVIQQ